jgi:hypothetical protein
MTERMTVKKALQFVRDSDDGLYGIDHRFINFSDDLAAWVIFYGPTGGES